MQMIRQWVVNSVDFRIPEQLLIRPVRLRNAERVSRSPGSAEISRSDGGDFRTGALLRGGNDLQRSDARDAKHAPADFSPGCPTCRWTHAGGIVRASQRLEA